MAYTELPLITTSTPTERLQALKDARELLTSKPGETNGSIFGGGGKEAVYAPAPDELLRLAEYITTGHDYKDTHPVGKRRPINKHMHVTVMAASGLPTPEDVEHLVEHIKDGSFEEFLRDAQNQFEDDKKQPGAEGDTK